MKIFNILFLTFLSTIVFAQNELRLPITLKKVTVFQNRAQLNSELKTTVAQGITKVYLTNIASTIDPNSIQVSGKGEVMILGVKHQMKYVGATQVSNLQKSLESLNDSLSILEVQAQVASHEETMMMANISIKNDKDGILPEDLKDMVEYFNQKLTEIGSRKLKLNKSIAKLKKQIDAINLEIESNTINAQVGTNEILVTISANTQAAMLLDINYLVNEASWSPTYDIRANGTNNPISLAYKANISQQTGLDWNNVLLTLSTANPSQNGVKPTMYPDFLNFYVPPTTQYKRSLPASKAEESIQSDQLAEVSEMVNEIVVQNASKISSTMADQIAMNENTLSANFEVKTPYTIPSNGNSEMIDVQNLTIPADFELSTVPKYDNGVFLLAKIGNWAKYNLISGTANVYFEGSFIGKTYLENNSTEDSLQISLGRDKKIIVKREEIAEFKSQKTVGSNVKLTQAYKITVKNTKNEVVSVLVEDQLPISQDSKIEVENNELTGGNLDLVTGKVTWNLKLNPNESKEIIVNYSVKYPKGKKINNLK